MKRIELLALMAAIISTHDADDQNALARAEDMLIQIENGEQSRSDAEAERA